MAERKVRNVFCKNCLYLDKSRTQESGEMLRYGCNRPGQHYTVGWVSRISGLNNMGCSACGRLIPGIWFRVSGEAAKKEKLKGLKLLYCGTVYGSGKPQRLLYWEANEDSGTFEVRSDILEGMKVKALYISEEVFKKSQSMARRIRKEYNRERECLPFV